MSEHDEGRPDGGTSVESGAAAPADPEADAVDADTDGQSTTEGGGERVDGSTNAGDDTGAEQGRTTAASGALAGVTVRRSVLRSTNHWVGIAGLAFLTAGLGVALRSQALLLSAVVGVGYLAYANASEAPEPSLAVARGVDDPDPDPGDRVDVTVTVENVGDAVLPDLRIVDDVPEALAVVDGPARTATALRPGARATFTYTVTARRGEFTFDGLTAIARNVSGSRERELDVEMATTTVTCLPPIDATVAVPLRGLTSPYTGRVVTDSSGEGVEFSSMREYQHGDSLSRIDWNHYARGGELATMEFRQERMATVVLLVDLRRAAYLRPGEDGPNAVDRSIDATRRLFNSLLDTGDRVGVAALATEAVWLAPGAGPTHQAQARHMLATHPALSSTPPDGRVYLRGRLRQLYRRLDDDAQVVFVSPVPDDASAYVARSLQVRGHAVTVVSPDPTLSDTPGHTLAAVARSNRLSDLRNAGIRVVDWDPDETLAEALERARRRWSA